MSNTCTMRKARAISLLHIHVPSTQRLSSRGRTQLRYAQAVDEKPANSARVQRFFGGAALGNVGCFLPFSIFDVPYHASNNNTVEQNAQRYSHIQRHDHPSVASKLSKDRDKHDDRRVKPKN